MPNSRPIVGYLLKKFPRLSETFILNEILELQRQGVDVRVLSLYAPDDGRFHADVSRLENPITYLPEVRIRDAFRELDENRDALEVILPGLEPAIKYMLDLGDYAGLPVMKRVLGVAFAVQKFGITHLHAHFATIAARMALAVKMLTGVSYSVTAHAKDIYRETVEPRQFARLVDGAKFMVTVCDANREYILERLAPGREDKVVRLYNGVDLDRFSPCDESIDDPPLVVAVGRLVPKKGFDVLIDAAAELKATGRRFRVAIAGDGEDRAKLERRVAERDVADVVQMLGALPQDAILPLYRRATVVCLPCVTDADGNRDALPTTLLEALGCRVAVISTPVGGVTEIVEDGRNGLIVPEGDVGALASSIARVLDDRALRAALGAAGRARAEERFDLRKNVAELKRRLLAPAYAPRDPVGARA